MTASNIQPLTNSKRTGDWKESSTRTAGVGQRKNVRPTVVYGQKHGGDTSSFSDILERTIRKNMPQEDELQTLIHLMSGGNDRIRNIAMSMTAPVPQSDALLDAAMARARVVPYNLNRGLGA